MTLKDDIVLNMFIAANILSDALFFVAFKMSNVFDKIKNIFPTYATTDKETQLYKCQLFE